MEERVIREEDLYEYIFYNLVMLGYAPTYNEMFDLVAIFFDFLEDNEIIQEL